MDDVCRHGAESLGEQLRYEHRVRRPHPSVIWNSLIWTFENSAAVFAVM